MTRMTRIIMNGQSNVALINCVQLWTLKSVDNALSFFKGTHKVLLGMQHGKRTEIINANGNFINVKVSLVRMVNGVGCNSHASDV